MADGALLLVDAAEGPLPQTRFVLRKAFECGLRPIVVINKIDRPDARPDDVLNAVFDLFVELDADDATLDFPTIYASGRQGIATTDLAVPATDLRPLFDAILKHVPPPEVELDAPLQMLVVTLDYSDYVGRIGIGRVVAGKIHKDQRIALLKHDGSRIDDTDRAALRLRPPGPHRDRRGDARATSAPWSAWTTSTSATPSPTSKTPSPCRRSRSTSRRWT